MEYTIKVNGKYFKEYIYATKENLHRYAGNTQNGCLVYDGDIVDLILTEDVQYTTTKRNLAEKVRLIYGIDKFKDCTIEIRPYKETIFK